MKLTDISPIDMSFLALIAGHRMSKSQAKNLLMNTRNPRTHRIADALVNPAGKTRVSKSDREAANAIKRWAASVGQKQRRNP